MTNLLNQLRQAAQKRSAYNATVAEIRRMPADIARDLNIYPGDAHRIARQAVYGG
jgi:hypothetical protein